jgi:hypothetical protein
MGKAYSKTENDTLTVDYELNRLLTCYEQSVEAAAMARNQVTITQLRQDEAKKALYDYLTDNMGTAETNLIRGKHHPDPASANRWVLDYDKGR